MSLFKKVGGAFKAAGHGLQSNLTNGIATPFQILGGGAAKAIQGVAPALTAATGVLQANPALAGLAGDALGVPGLGGLFGGAPAPNANQPFSSPGGSGGPNWLLIGGIGLAAVVGFFLVTRK